MLRGSNSTGLNVEASCGPGIGALGPGLPKADKEVDDCDDDTDEDHDDKDEEQGVGVEWER